MRVGRAAIDDEAMRLLAERNPDLQFDWSRLLREAAPDPASRRDRDREGRDGRDRDRRERRDPRQPPRPRPMDTSAVAVPPLPTPEAAEEIQALAEAAEERAAEHAASLATAAEEAAAGDTAAEDTAAEDAEDAEKTAAENAERAETTAVEDTAAEDAEAAENFAAEEAAAERAENSAAEEAAAEDAEDAEKRAAENAESRKRSPPEEAETAASARLGVDGVRRLRSRYADIAARLAEKELDEGARAELTASAARLNPDAWSTPEEVTAALEQYEAVFESLRTVVGRHPRRRRV